MGVGSQKGVVWGACEAPPGAGRICPSAHGYFSRNPVLANNPVVLILTCRRSPLFAPCIITANNSSLVSAGVGARKETTCANLSKATSIRRRHRPAAAQLAFTSSCCGQVHVKYGILNEECFCHEIGPILADELFTAFWQGMAVVVKP